MKYKTEKPGKGPTPEEIYIAIVTSLKYINKCHEFLITGISGPTGKSWLCRKLKDAGYIAYDLTDVPDPERAGYEFNHAKQYKRNYFDTDNNKIYLVERLDLNKIRKGEEYMKKDSIITSKCDSCTHKEVCYRKKEIESMINHINQAVILDGHGSSYPLTSYLKTDGVSLELNCDAYNYDVFEQWGKKVKKGE